MLENKSYYNKLFDCYGMLFTDNQIEYFKQYFHDDLSLSEISENLSISRAAISKQLKYIKEMLEHYEQQLHLAELYDNLDEIVNDFESLSKEEIRSKLEGAINV